MRKMPSGGLLGLFPALFILACVAFACAEANPLPTPSEPDFRDDAPVGEAPGRDEGGSTFFAESRVYLSALGTEESDEESVVLVGAPGATSHEGAVRIELEESDEAFDLPTDPQRGFATRIAGASEGARITLTMLPTLFPEEMLMPGAESIIVAGREWQLARLTLTVRRLTGAEPNVPWLAPYGDSDAVPPGAEDPAESGAEPPSHDDDPYEDGVGRGLALSGPDEDGHVLLSAGTAGMTPFSKLLVFNATRDESHVGRASNDGSLEMRFKASSGDVLTMFAANPADPSATTTTFTRAVP